MSDISNDLLTALNGSGFSDELRGSSGELKPGTEGDVETYNPIESEPLEINKVESSIPSFIDSDMANDYKMARSILYTLSEVLCVAIGDATAMAKMIQHPKAYEVLGMLIKNLGDNAKDIVKLQETYVKIVKDLKVIIPEDGTGPEPGTTAGDRVLEAKRFVGTASDLLSALDKQANDELKSLEDEDEDDDDDEFSDYIEEDGGGDNQ